MNTLTETNLCAVNDELEDEVEKYEERYRGRELPGFINYKTFESIVKKQIKQLEEPAVKTLKDVGGWRTLNGMGIVCLDRH